MKFGNLLLKSYTRQVWPKVSRHRAWQTDEMYILNQPVVGTVDPQTNQVFLTAENNERKETMTNHLLRVATRWKKLPRGWWTDGHASYPPAIEKLPEHVPHGTVNHSKWEFKNRLNQTTNAIENVWRQLRRWLSKKNSLKKLEHRHLHIGIFQIAHTNTFKDDPLQMIRMLLDSKPT